MNQEQQQIYDRRLVDFTKNVIGRGIENYFQIKNVGKTTILFQEQPNNTALLTIKYVYVNFDIKKNNIKQLPFELNDIISSYLPTYITITLKIDYPDGYPFKPPLWSLMMLSHNVNVHVDMKNYYDNIVAIHNADYEKWSPAIWIEKDLILFISRVNHFDSIMREML